MLTETIDSSVPPDASRTVSRMAYSPGGRPDVDHAPRVPFATGTLQLPIVRHAPSGPRHWSVYPAILGAVAVPRMVTVPDTGPEGLLMVALRAPPAPPPPGVVP